jgi:ubiquinone/menaquinone biosynthesis C-methylase UbiE
MKILDTHTKFALLGKPGTYFTYGFERRLEMIQKRVDLEGKKILDMGCGEGVWTFRFAEITDPKNVYGSDFDVDQIKSIRNLTDKGRGGIPPENFVGCPGENLDFEDNTFDIVFHNEVLEHVQDDKKTIEECLRVLKPGGLMIFFTPNTLWPFEQHGMFFRGKYYWGNIPLLPYMPNFIYKKLAPHVRNYGSWTLKRILKEANGEKEIVLFTQIFSGFDGLIRRFGVVGKVIQKIIHFLEKTPLHIFGISHFVIVKKG